MSYLTIKTGTPGCLAHFYPAKYRIDLIDEQRRQRIDLSFAGSRVLECLLDAAGEVVSRDALLSHAWADRVVSQGSLNQQIHTLRRLLHDKDRRRIIQTLPSRGYLFNPEFLVPGTERASIPEPVESRSRPMAAPTPGVVGTRATRRRRTWSLHGAWALALLLSSSLVAPGLRPMPLPFIHQPLDYHPVGHRYAGASGLPQSERPRETPFISLRPARHP